MTQKERTALKETAIRNIEIGTEGMKEQDWVILLNCYSQHISPSECAALLRRKADTIRRLYLKLSYVSIHAVLS